MSAARAIASLGTGPHARLLKIAARTFRPFAERHGYDLHLHTELADPSRPAPWSKVPILRDLLDRYEAVLWLDSDLMIVDPREDVPLPDGLMGLVEHATGEGRVPNTGVWILRAGDEAREFLDAVWAQEDLVDHRWWENAAVMRLLSDERWRSRTTWLDPRWNSIPDSPAEHPRIRHYPGYSVKTRAAFMLRDLLARRR